ncbi:unnamed protein product [Brassicogethes aeneus]|uniref:CWH43-like N-terminal domain-containing protein n=1 Tax=Brassicogethes aeneus TaxID=1431903 RepID=A0A9P0B2R2_BRAAE|nr:unnamed protein product [Brassicogethes aeneus]
MLQIHHVPVIILNSLLVTTITTVSLAYYYGHITYYVPYISDSGTYPPESCIFAQSLNIISALMAFIIYVRYLQVNEIITRSTARLESYNKICLILGFIACLGVSLVGNFQETNTLVIHWIASTMAFGGGSLYQLVQNIMAFKENKIFSSNLTRNLQKVSTVVSIASFIIFFCTGLISLSQFRGEYLTKWKEEDGGYDIHIISTVTEWICASTILGYLSLFSQEFKEINFKGISVSLKSKDLNLNREFEGL